MNATIEITARMVMASHMKFNLFLVLCCMDI